MTAKDSKKPMNSSEAKNHFSGADSVQNQLEFLLGVTKTGIDIIDDEYNLLYVDPSWQTLYGEFQGKKCYDYFMGRTQPCPSCGIRKALKTKRVQITEEVLVKEGSRVVEVHTIPFQKEDGRWVVGEFNIDITDRKEFDRKVGQYVQDLEYLHQRSIQMLDLDNESDFYSFIGSVIRELVPPRSIIAISEVDSFEKKITTRSIFGYEHVHDPPLIQLIHSLTGRSYPLEEHIIAQMKKGTLEEFPGGFRALTQSRIPESLYQRIENEHGLGLVYGIGMNWRDTLLGSLAIILPPDSILENKSLIEIFVNLASIEYRRRKTEEALQEERRLFIGGPVIVFRWGTGDEWPIYYVSPNITGVLGYYPEELTSGAVTLSEIFHPDDLPRIIREVNQHCDEGRESFEQEYRIKRRDGNYRWIYDFTVTERDDAGSILSFQGYALDITERKEIEQKLLESEENARALINAPHESIFMISPDGIVLYVNETNATRLGFTPDEMIGKSVYQFVSEEIAERRRQYVHEVLETKKPVHILDERNGRIIENNLYPVLNTAGEVTRIAIYGHDVTEMHEYQQKILESETKYRELVENAASIIMRFDTSANILYFNEYAEEFFGFSKEEVLGKSIFNTILEETDSSGKNLQEMIQNMMENPEKFVHNENENICKDKRKVWISWRNKPLYENGRFIGLLSVGTDITQRKKTEEALSEANKKLNLLSSITRHDVLNLITALKGYQELSFEIETDEKKKDFLKKEIDLTNSIQSQIEFTKDYQDLGLSAPIWHDVSACIDRAQNRLGISSIHSTISFSEVSIFADPLFEKVIYTLLDNSIRHGERVTRISWGIEQKSDGYTLVCEDDGIGILDVDKERIFIRGVGKNTGLGLFLSREILTITGLTIRETGLFGKGARFEIEIPPGALKME